MVVVVVAKFQTHQKVAISGFVPRAHTENTPSTNLYADQSLNITYMRYSQFKGCKKKQFLKPVRDTYIYKYNKSKKAIFC